MSCDHQVSAGIYPVLSAAQPEFDPLASTWGTSGAKTIASLEQPTRELVLERYCCESATFPRSSSEATLT
jgi:hypothetical protein